VEMTAIVVIYLAIAAVGGLIAAADLCTRPDHCPDEKGKSDGAERKCPWTNLTVNKHIAYSKTLYILHLTLVSLCMHACR